MKRCVIVLLASCITQGIGWLFGPFLTFTSPTAGEVLGWFFIVCNGLEGLWATIIYIIIRSQHLDEKKRVSSVVALKTSNVSKSDHYKRSSIDIGRSDDDEDRQQTDIEIRNSKDEISDRFEDLVDLRSINWPDNDNGNDDGMVSHV
jgi:hypothetical protein